MFSITAPPNTFLQIFQSRLLNFGLRNYYPLPPPPPPSPLASSPSPPPLLRLSSPSPPSECPRAFQFYCSKRKNRGD